MMLLVTNIYLFLTASILAILEIQIEGKDGWVKNLPTWKPNHQKWYSKIYSLVMSGKQMTGYHLAMFSLVILLLNFPYASGQTLTLESFLKTLSYFFMFVVTWDFLWFVLNPHFSLKFFKKEKVWWHSRWFLNIPLDYYFGIIFSCVVLFPIWKSDPAIYIWWGQNLALFAAQIILLAVIARYILKVGR